ncbi:MAG: hypothetical protein JKY48_15700 [Flavobacteriales bacterium]|nr:hypothetical protein [Flavobacteriales bacterium]
MKKMKALVAVSLMVFGLSSCVVYETHSVTGNPIGTKKGVAKTKLFGNSDVTMRTAAKNGKITKIGSVDTKTTVFILPFSKTVVTGE